MGALLCRVTDIRVFNPTRKQQDNTEVEMAPVASHAGLEHLQQDDAYGDLMRYLASALQVDKWNAVGSRP